MAAVGEGTQAVFAPAFGCPDLASSISAISSGFGHMPLPICARPRNPVARPTSTFESSYARIHGCCLITSLRNTAPASILVCISSPVRSRKPVLIKTMRAFASATQAFRLIEVRRSSSMTPIFNVFRASPKVSSMRSKSETVKATSSGPCIFGLTI